MSRKRGLGIGLIFAGIFIIASVRVLTGAVVGVKPENYLGIFGVLVGGILLLGGGGSEERYHFRGLEKIIGAAGRGIIDTTLLTGFWTPKGLVQRARFVAGEYSEGNKRKLK